MIGIGHSLGLPMTAAKVETEQQLRLLRSLGLDRAQGELFAPPLSADAALELVRSGQVWAALLEATARPCRAAERRARGGRRAAQRRSRAGRAGGGAEPRPGRPRAADLDLDRAPLGGRGRLGTTRTAGGHRRFAASEVRRLLAERGRPQVAPTDAPRRALPDLAALVEGHGARARGV